MSLKDFVSISYQLDVEFVSAIDFQIIESALAIKVNSTLKGKAQRDKNKCGGGDGEEGGGGDAGGSEAERSHPDC